MAQIVREHGISEPTFYQWKSKPRTGLLPRLQLSLAGLLALAHRSATDPLPDAYLKLEVYSADSVKQAEAWAYVSDTVPPGQWQRLLAKLSVGQDGYLEAKLVDESPTPVYFDDLLLKISKERGIQENHYDPWGLNLVGIESQPVDRLERKQYNGKEKVSDFGLEWNFHDARTLDKQTGRWCQVDPLAGERSDWTPYQFGRCNPMRNWDPSGLLDDWVQNESGEIYWDNNATSQASTKPGETYLGEDLVFTFNSFINSTFDGPVPPWEVTGDKLTSTVTVDATKNKDGSLQSVDVTSSYKVGATAGLSIFTGRDYFPGLGSDQNKSVQVTGATSFKASFEQHASVPAIEGLGLNMLGYDVVNIAQRLNLGLSGNRLSVSASTDVFPSASLSVNGVGLFQYSQPSFSATHGRDKISVGISEMRGGPMFGEISRRPPPQLYSRYKK